MGGTYSYHGIEDLIFSIWHYHSRSVLFLCVIMICWVLLFVYLKKGGSLLDFHPFYHLFKNRKDGFGKFMRWACFWDFFNTK